MTSFLFPIIFRWLSYLPLPVLHRLGAWLGRLIYLSSTDYALRTRENLLNAKLHNSDREYKILLQQTITEAGKSILELPWIWHRPLDEVYAAVRSVHGWEHIESALAAGKGIILLTPHWGCFEIISSYCGKSYAITNLYRAPKLAWVESFMRNGRQRGKAKLATADIKGVRTLYKALKQGEIIGMLPDQVPGNGEGEWVEFFHRPAYTMTLVGRLAQGSGAALLMVTAERLARGEGYALRVEPLQLEADFSVPLQINRAMERCIALAPAQYLWSYNRYKAPKGVATPEQQ